MRGRGKILSPIGMPQAESNILDSAKQVKSGGTALQGQENVGFSQSTQTLNNPVSYPASAALTEMFRLAVSWFGFFV